MPETPNDAHLHPAPSVVPSSLNPVACVASSYYLCAGYVNAGTVEFLLDTATQKYYFMEVRTSHV